MSDQSKVSANLPEYHVAGYEDLEISTQIIIAEAQKRGLEIEVLDRFSNFLRLTKEDKTELVQQASKTRLDSYMTFLVMENKVVTKHILAEAGVRVPVGGHYSKVEEAVTEYPNYTSKNLVIKPTSTNFGIGVSFLKQPHSLKPFRKLVQETFKHDNTIIVENLIPGEEYRFIVIDYKVCGVCQRVPANVVGNGKQSIEELIELKNQDPRRGQNYNRPLEVIKICDTVKSFLDDQKLTPSSVPDLDKQIFLRANSNISTGGDSIDRTEEVNQGYFAIAEKAAQAVGSRITGVDMMIENIADPPHFSNHAVIEMNFNPVLYIHDYPYQGKNRRVGAAVLDALGFS